MSTELRWLTAWYAVAVALLVMAGLGVAAGPADGAAIGLVVGASYTWLLWRRVQAVSVMSLRHALVAARVGMILRMVFVLAAFDVASRLWPGAGLRWGALFFLVPVIARMVALARGVGS